MLLTLEWRRCLWPLCCFRVTWGPWWEKLLSPIETGSKALGLSLLWIELVSLKFDNYPYFHENAPPTVSWDWFTFFSNSYFYCFCKMLLIKGPWIFWWEPFPIIQLLDIESFMVLPDYYREPILWFCDPILRPWFIFILPSFLRKSYFLWVYICDELFASRNA